MTQSSLLEGRDIKEISDKQMRILFICGSVRAQEACSMTLSELGLQGRVEIGRRGNIKELLGDEELIILDDVYGLHDEVSDLMSKGRWVFRVRDRLAPLSNKKGAIEEILSYSSRGVTLAHLDEEIAEAFSEICEGEAIHLPDVFGSEEMPDTDSSDELINVGCFGSRGNRLAHGFAVLELSRRTNCPVMFHCDLSRESSAFENLQMVFSQSDKAFLATYKGIARKERRKLMALLDVGLQVGARPEKLIISDYIDIGIPVVTGQTEEWLSPWTADVESPSDMCEQAMAAMKWKSIGKIANKLLLWKEVGKSIETWARLTG